MARFSLHVTWLDPPDPDEAFGPERSTWGRLKIELDGRVVTAHWPRGGGGREDAVVGGLSGLAEWVVDQWMSVSWEIHTPFPKGGGAESRVPVLGDVRRGRLSRDLLPSVVAAWQGRHVLGAAASDLALPSITLVPEEREIGICVAPPPDLDGDVMFDTSPWSSGEPLWISKDDVVEELTRFVTAVVDRAEAQEDTATWALWLRARFEAAQALARDEPSRRRALFGPVAADGWDRIVRPLGPDADVLAGVLLDSELVERGEDLQALAGDVRKASREAPLVDLWKKVRRGPGSAGRRPYERGYDLAAAARTVLGEPTAPLTDLRETLEQLGIGWRSFSGAPLFRSAVLRPRDGGPVVLQAKSHPRNAGVAPVRFAIAAAVGRLFAHPSTAAGFGAAHGPQSRWQAAQEANAFAAELLLPAQALRSGSLQDLCEQYGISHSAAKWHLENRIGTSAEA